MEAWREELYAGELYHYGVKGMKWRHRKKYDVSDNRNEKKMTKLEAMQKPHLWVSTSVRPRVIQNKKRKMKSTPRAMSRLLVSSGRQAAKELLFSIRDVVLK